MTGKLSQQSPEDIRAEVVRAIAAQMRTLVWIPDDEKVLLNEAMMEFVPAWHAWLHRQRLKGWMRGADIAGEVRSAGVMVLSNMLAALASNTTVQLPGEDRRAVVRATTKKLHQS